MFSLILSYKLFIGDSLIIDELQELKKIEIKNIFIMCFILFIF